MLHLRLKFPILNICNEMLLLILADNILLEDVQAQSTARGSKGKVTSNNSIGPKSRSVIKVRHFPLLLIYTHLLRALISFCLCVIVFVFTLSSQICFVMSPGQH